MNRAQTEYQSKGLAAALTQADMILARLQETPGEWVSMLELHQRSGAFAVHSRIADLRCKLGLKIEHENDWVRNEQGRLMCHSRYRLCPLTPALSPSGGEGEEEGK